jgi:manganese/zinc/iron transport system permease protein
MNLADLIPPFDIRSVLVDPWTTDFPEKGWILLMGFLTSVACGWVGQHLLLRRMALMGDAISHSILPGLATAFLVASFLFGQRTDSSHAARDSSVMLVGAIGAGWITTLLIGMLHRRSRIKQDAAIGIVFATLFAIGVVLITLFADHVDLDADCVLYGEIGFVPFQPTLTAFGIPLGPVPVTRMAVVTLLTVLATLLFYKELVISSFDAGLATSLGIHAPTVHLLLMGWLSVVVVSAFESVGAILVIAMLIVPGATASLVATRLPNLFILIVVHSAISTVAGLHLALWLDCSIAGAMVVAGCVLFALAWATHALLRARDVRHLQPDIPPSSASDESTSTALT